jgi:hypothetical protein
MSRMRPRRRRRHLHGGLLLLLAAPGVLVPSLSMTARACDESGGAASLAECAGRDAALAADSLFTDLDGVSGIVRFLLEISANYPTYDETWQGALRWLDAVAESVSTPLGMGYRWPVALGIPLRYRLSNSAYIGKRYLDAYVRTGNRAYLDRSLGAMRYLASWAQRAGPGVRWPWSEVDPTYVVGFLVGNASICQYMLDVYQVTGSRTALASARDGTAWLMSVARPESTGYSWHEYASYGDLEPGWCRGAAGLSDLFYNMFEALGDSVYLQYGNGALDWLASTAESEYGGYRWPAYHWSGRVLYQTGEGGGAAGIGRRFLRGWRMTGDPRYLACASGAAEWLMAIAEPTAGGGYRWLDNLTTRRELLSQCQGYSGIAQFFTDLWTETRVPAYRDHAVGLCRWLMTLAAEDAGGYAWPKTAIWLSYWPSWLGTAGVSSVLLSTGQTFGVPEFVEAARAGACWLRNTSWEEQGGLTWPYQVQLPAPGGEATPCAEEPPPVLPPTPDLPSSSFSLAVRPNPFRTAVEFALVLPGSLVGEAAALRVMDASGRPVWNRAVTVPGDSHQVVSWDGRDRSGRPVAPGVYFVVLDAAETMLVRKVVVER